MSNEQTPLAAVIAEASAKLRLIHHDMYQKISIHASGVLDEIAASLSAAAEQVEKLDESNICLRSDVNESRKIIAELNRTIQFLNDEIARTASQAELKALLKEAKAIYAIGLNEADADSRGLDKAAERHSNAARAIKEKIDAALAQSPPATPPGVPDEVVMAAKRWKAKKRPPVRFAENCAGSYMVTSGTIDEIEQMLLLANYAAADVAAWEEMKKARVGEM